MRPAPEVKPEVLLTGGSGQLGWELRRCLSPISRLYSPSRNQLPFEEAETLRQLIRVRRPALVVNAAAYTAVDQAESEPDLADAINHRAVAVLGEECSRLGIPVVHFSTDYVFDGSARSPRRESDPVNPLSVYGRTKLGGEQALLASGASCLIFRTGWIYGLRGRNFLLTMLRLAREHDRINVVDDQTGGPTWSRLIAESVALVLNRCRDAESGFRIPPERAGLYHLAAGGETSWYGFAQMILTHAPGLPSGRSGILHPIPTSEYPTPARRPAYSVLDCGRATTMLGITLPRWETQLRMALDLGPDVESD